MKTPKTGVSGGNVDDEEASASVRLRATPTDGPPLRGFGAALVAAACGLAGLWLCLRWGVHWTGMLYPAVKWPLLLVIWVLLITGLVLIASAARTPFTRIVAAVGIGLTALVGASIAALVMGVWVMFGLDTPVGDWAFAQDGERAVTVVATTDNSGDAVWEAVFIAPGWVSTTTTTSCSLGSRDSDEPPTVSFVGDTYQLAAKGPTFPGGNGFGDGMAAPC